MLFTRTSLTQRKQHQTTSNGHPPTLRLPRDMMIRHENTTVAKTYVLCCVSLQPQLVVFSIPILISSRKNWVVWLLFKGSHVTVELNMGHLCFLWTLRREKGCWTTSAECPTQFGVSMPMDAIDRSGFRILKVIFWWAGFLILICFIGCLNSFSTRVIKQQHGLNTIWAC